MPEEWSSSESLGLSCVDCLFGTGEELGWGPGAHLAAFLDMGVGPVDNDFELEPDDPGELFLGDDLFPAVDIANISVDKLGSTISEGWGAILALEDAINGSMLDF